jgi:hypothetical protein
MTLRITEVLDFVHRPGLKKVEYKVSETGCFSEGTKTLTMLDTLERATLSHRDQVSETLF